MDDYKPNSNRFKEEQKNNVREKRVDKPVVKGKVISKKKSKLSRLTSEFISEDAKNVKSYVFCEVLIPTIKKAISDIVRDGIDMILFGESKRGNRRSTADKVSYRNYYDRDDRVSRADRPVVSATDLYEDVIVETRGEAEDVLDRMYELMGTYGLVRVADLYDLVGKSTTNYMINKYGWTNISNAEIVHVREGYLIKMPRAIPIG